MIFLFEENNRQIYKDLKRNMLSTIEYYYMMNYNFPKGYIWTSWEDLKDGFESGIDDDLETAQCLVDILDKDIKSIEKIKGLKYEDPDYEEFVDLRDKLKTSINRYVKSLNESISNENGLTKFVPYDKMSKKQKEEEDRKARGSWNGINPVSRTAPDKTKYNRNRNKKVNFDESLNQQEKSIYINAIKDATNKEELEDIVHEIFFYDKALFVKLRHFPKDISFKDQANNMIKILSESCNKQINEVTILKDYKPSKVGKAYKVFKVKNGKLYPPMVANHGGEDTPVGEWLMAEEGEFAGLSKTGRKQVKQAKGGRTLSYRPGWHLGDIPRASQFDRTNKETGEKEFPKDFVWAECEYVMDIDYQSESDEQGYMRTKPDGTEYRSDKYQHSLAGLTKLPKDGYYKYRTNPRPDTVPWVITGAIKVNKLLDDFEVNEILKSNGVEPIHRQGGDKTLKELGL